jgi:hypothetical protein
MDLPVSSNTVPGRFLAPILSCAAETSASMRSALAPTLIVRLHSLFSAILILTL